MPKAIRRAPLKKVAAAPAANRDSGDIKSNRNKNNTNLHRPILVLVSSVDRERSRPRPYCIRRARPDNFPDSEVIDLRDLWIACYPPRIEGFFRWLRLVTGGLAGGRS